MVGDNVGGDDGARNGWRARLLYSLLAYDEIYGDKKLAER